jgi:hypothetical protein
MKKKGEGRPSVAALIQEHTEELLYILCITCISDSDEGECMWVLKN